MAGGEKCEFVDQLVVQSIRKPQSPLHHPAIALIDSPLRISAEEEEEEETGSSVGVHSVFESHNCDLVTFLLFPFKRVAALQPGGKEVIRLRKYLNVEISIRPHSMPVSI